MTNPPANLYPVIAIDGPSASGKGTVAQRVADKLGFHYLDSGALYRIVAFSALKNNIDWHDHLAITAHAKTSQIVFKCAQIFLDGQDISEEIRTELIGKGASIVAVHADLREALLNIQHSFARSPGLVADGRDMGTVVFPFAVLKIFLTASTEIRAERRYKQLLGKNQVADLQAIRQDLTERDARDQQRTSAPLTIANDAILLETDNRGIDAAVDFILQHFQGKISK